MKKTLKDFGGLILFYTVIVFGVLLLSINTTSLNNKEIVNESDNYIAMNN